MMNTGLNLYLANLGKYNEGELVGKWISLPITEEELSAELAEIGINEYYEEYAIHDVDNYYNFDFNIGEYSNVMEISEQVEKIEELTEYEFKMLSSYMDVTGSDFDEALENYEDAHYVEIDGNTFYSKKAQLAENYIDECIGGVEHLDRETLMRYFDFEAYGKDLAYAYSLSEQNDMYVSTY